MGLMKACRMPLTFFALVAAVLTPAQAEQHLKYFGYVGVDCKYDDPYDLSLKTTYIDEVKAFTNLNHMCVFGADDIIVERARTMANNGMRALLSVQGVFFSYLDRIDPSTGRLVVLYPDYMERWARFVAANQTVLDPDHVGTIYLVDEPFNAGIPYEELRAVADLVKATFPDIPASFVESWAFVGEMQVPPSIDWIGFDHYQTRDPYNDATYRGFLETLKSRRSRPDQKIVIVLDAHWTPFHAASAHGSALPPGMDDVARSYYRLASAEPDVIAMIGYAWVGGIDVVSLGTRQLPRRVIQEHVRIGKEIIGA